ncbi:MAG: IS701 family transposase [Acidobacteria bacterium]|nr:IS701 family transposase [Acidobacteriota bacterium]
MLDRTATAWLRRLVTWLELFEDGFSRERQRGAMRRYVTGLLNDSRRKSMEAMWARLSDPGTYQAFQHFITHAPWDAEALWTRLRAVIPERRGVLILDSTSFPKQGTASVGVARQYCGALGKTANCQVAVTIALWTGVRAWFVGAYLYLPEAWLTSRQRVRARIPDGVVFRPKGQLALTLWRQVRAAGFDITAVVGDAEFGNNATLRRALHRAKLPYALGVSSDLTVFLGTPRLVAPPAGTGKGRPRTRPLLPPDTTTIEARAWAATQPPRQWRLVSWRNGTHAPRRARFCATRVTPAHDWRERRLAPEVWLLCERDCGPEPRTRYYLVHLPATASLRALARLAHQRWAIEQQYQELKDEIGLDHFEGRTLPGWQRHVVLTAIAYSFLQQERRRRGQTHLTLPRVRAVIQEVLTAHFFMTQPHYFKWMLALKDVEMRN